MNTANRNQMPILAAGAVFLIGAAVLFVILFSATGTLKDGMESLQAAAEANKADIEAVKADVAGRLEQAEAALSDLEQKVKTDRTELDEQLSGKITAAREAVDELQAEHQRLAREVEELGETVTEIYESIDPADRLYAIGDKGPAGGLIFYDDEADGVDDIPGYRYLEAAPYGWYNGKDDPAVQWGRSFSSRPVNPSAAGTNLGEGITNTEHIVQYHDSLGDYYSNPQSYDALNDGTVAAKICRDFELEIDGKVYDDWFLPAIDTLELMYENLHTQDLGDFFTGFYWSSSEDSSYDARRFAFNRGLRNSSRKDLRHYVRPVRAF